MKTPKGVRRNRRRVQTGVISITTSNGETWAYYRRKDPRIEGWWPWVFYRLPQGTRADFEV